MFFNALRLSYDAAALRFGTIAMIAEGCIMARICHTNKCPVGVTTQKEELRKKFPGTPQNVVTFFQVGKAVTTMDARALRCTVRVTLTCALISFFSHGGRGRGRVVGGGR